MLPESLDLESLLVPGGYRFSMGLKRIGASEFFGAQERRASGTDLLEIRSALLRERPGDFVCEPADRADSTKVLHFASEWADIPRNSDFRELATRWEPDFVLLHRSCDQSIVRQPVPDLDIPLVVAGGCVCFPTGWSLPDKVGKALPFVHGPVPGLNDAIGPQIHRMLNSIRTGDCYQRMNWGFSSSEMFNQHPNQHIQKIQAEFDPATIYLRIEWQALAALDDSRLLFGIRIYNFTLEVARRNERLAQLLAVHLKTMPAAVAKYKRIEECRERVISYLT
jgi:heme-dependent oxidative N-demethylase alpha subunit-like protein